MTNHQGRRQPVSKLGPKGRLRLAAAGLFAGAAGMLPAHADTLVRLLDDQQQVRFAVSLPLQNQAELAQLQQQLYTPGSAQFHQFLSSAEFDARFAPTAAQYADAESLLRQYGVEVVGEHSSRTLIDVQASAATIRDMFGAQMRLMQRADGRQYFDADREAVVPFVLSALGGKVAALHQKPLQAHYNVHRAASEAEVSLAAQPHAGTGKSGSYAPADIKAAYNLDGIQNHGTPVALFELSSAWYHNATVYASKFGLNAPTLVQKKVDGGELSTTGSTEVMLDIEMVMAVSNPSTIYVYTGPNSDTGVLDTYSQIADDDLVNQVSTSWGECEADEGSSDAGAENTVFTKMVMEGIAVFAAAGDSGAYDCGGSTLGVDDPASQPEVTGVGGTSLTTTSSQAYVSEAVWDTSSTEGGGGGISTLWGIPSYQMGAAPDLSPSQYSAAMRNVPDVTLDADPATGFYIYDTDGCLGWCIVGGTSDAAPQWAAFWSLVGQGLGKGAGFANPVLYPLAENASSYAADFHDVTAGSNNYFKAYPGYDDASGWGSYNGASLYAGVIKAVGSSGITAPAVPADVTASGTDADLKGAVTLSWTGDKNVTQYSIYMGTSAGGESATPVATVTGPGYEVTGLKNFTKYYFKVEASNPAGSSAASSEASATTL